MNVFINFQHKSFTGTLSTQLHSLTHSHMHTCTDCIVFITYSATEQSLNATMNLKIFDKFYVNIQVLIILLLMNLIGAPLRSYPRHPYTERLPTV